MAETQTTTITREELLDVVIPASAGGFLRFVAGGSTADQFYRRVNGVNGRWRALDPEHSSIGDFVVAHVHEGVFFSPVSWSRPTWPGVMVSSAVVWASIRLGLGPQRREQPRPPVLDGERERAIASFANSPTRGWPLTALIDQGDSVVGIWRLQRELTDADELRAALQTLARAFGGDPAMTDPREALIAIPGTRCVTVAHAPTVSVVVWEPSRTYPVDFSRRV